MSASTRLRRAAITLTTFTLHAHPRVSTPLSSALSVNAPLEVRTGRTDRHTGCSRRQTGCNTYLKCVARAIKASSVNHRNGYSALLRRRHSHPEISSSSSSSYQQATRNMLVFASCPASPHDTASCITAGA